MERLTDPCWKNLSPWECCGQEYFCERDCHEEGGCTNGCIVPKIYGRLAAYEDTWLTPEQCAEYGKADREGRYIVLLDAEQEGVKHLRELAKADKEGRVVVLPCNKALTNADRMRTATNQQLAKQLYDNQKELCRMLYKNLGLKMN